MRLHFAVFFGFLLFLPTSAHAQNWGSVTGHVTEAPGQVPLPGATVLVDGTNFGTATDEAGAYELRLPAGRHALRFSSVGYAPRVDSVTVRTDQETRLDVSLQAVLVEMENLTVEDVASPEEAGVYTLSPEEVRSIPAPFKDGFRALKVLPGVATNNELSNQYSVRGGGFNENLIFINGFEVYMPFRPRQGEQEGLGLLNPELAEQLTFYTGGFPARYGGKLSSALDVRYRRPDGEPLHGAASLSLLDADAHAGASALNGRLGWTAGLRKARAHRFFSTQDLKGSYQPDYTDLQGTLSYRLAPGHSLEALGIWAEHDFRLDPRSRKTYFGIVSLDPQHPSNLQSLWTDYDASSMEHDTYATRFGGLRLTNRLTSRLRAEHDLAYFQTVETEYYDVAGSAVLYQVDPGSGNPNTGAGHLPIGNARQEDAADNRVRVSSWTAGSRWMYTTRRHAAEAGAQLRGLWFSDQLNEKSVIAGRNRDGEPARLVVDSLADDATFDARQVGLYVQDALDVLPQSGRFVVTAGLRADYFSFNDEWTAAPRLSMRYRLSERTTLTGAWGLYHQAPTYRELRGKPAPGESILGTLNHDIRSQRAMQLVAGAEYFLPKHRLYLRGEAYWKALSHLISYDIENVRVLYSGENDAEGHVYGLDLQLRGEFVPGLESWVNYSFMVAREAFLPAYQTEYNEGLIPRPTDQRHTFSAFIQDYVPGDPTWKLHLRALFGSGLPYTPPIPGRRLGGITLQMPGDRFSARYNEYMRVDMGVTKSIEVFEEDARASGLRLQLTAELLNVFDMTNTVAYAWIPGADGIWNRVPTRLTPRTLNVRVRVSF